MFWGGGWFIFVPYPNLRRLLVVSCISNLLEVFNSDLGGGFISGPSRNREGHVVVVCILLDNLVRCNLTFTKCIEV